MNPAQTSLQTDQLVQKDKTIVYLYTYTIGVNNLYLVPFDHLVYSFNIGNII